MTVQLYRRTNGNLVIEFTPPLKPDQEIDQMTQSAIDRFFNEAMKNTKQLTETEETK